MTIFLKQEKLYQRLIKLDLRNVWCWHYEFEIFKIIAGTTFPESLLVQRFNQVLKSKISF